MAVEDPSQAVLGTSPLNQFRCAGCGYGASRTSAPERCPMCSGSVWDFAPWRPLGIGSSELDAQAPLSREAER